MTVIEHFFDCPHCGAPISLLLDLSVPQQRYIEDCEVCCHPIEIHYQTDGERLVRFDVETA